MITLPLLIKFFMHIISFPFLIPIRYSFLSKNFQLFNMRWIVSGFNFSFPNSSVVMKQDAKANISMYNNHFF